MQELNDAHKKPDHVPDDVFVPGNIWAKVGDRPHDYVRRVAAGRPILYLQTHHHAGHSPRGTWLAASAETNRQILMTPDSFSSVGATIFGKILGGLTFFPVEVDPPDHAKYRSVLAPFFKPASIAALESVIRARVDEMLDELIPKGGCDFVPEFGRAFPASIFLDIMGLPRTRAREFLGWAKQALNAPTLDEKQAVMRRIRDYLVAEINSRREHPREDTLSGISHGQVDGRPITVDEATGCAVVLFLGGLDTVANQLGWTFRQLAEDPEMQAQLRRDPSQISRVNEELLRFFSAVTLSRRAIRDVEIAGVTIKAGDTVCCSMTLASRDAQEFAEPDVLDIARPPRRHLAFGYGPHTCVGLHLAKLELKIVMERWLARVPPFRLAPEGKIETHGGANLALDSLPLTWS